MPQAPSPDRETIFIPQEIRGQRLTAFPLSVRLRHVLEYKGFRLLGDLHRASYSDLLHFRNCGAKTIAELRQIVRALQQGREVTAENEVGPLPRPPVQAEGFCIPARARELSVSDLPLSVRLAGVLKEKGISRLGELHGLTLTELSRLDNCGRKTLGELVRLIDRAATGEFDAADDSFRASKCGEVLKMLDGFVEKLRPRDREALLLRLGWENGRALTLEEIGARIDLTRERVRQIERKAVGFIRKEGGRKLASRLRGLTATCTELVCPLTPALLSRWLGQQGGEHFLPLAAYVRLLGKLNPRLPVWPSGQEPSARQEAFVEELATALEEVLQTAPQGLSLKTALESVRTRLKMRELAVGDFLNALRNARDINVDLSRPDEPMARLRRLGLARVAMCILDAATEPLTPEEILAHAQAQFGAELASWDVRTIANSLTPERGFYLLGPRAYGLRRHFKLAESRWRGVRNDVHGFLKEQNRPVSTADILSEGGFGWGAQSNKHELGQILREDSRFVDLGRLLFGLAEWGVKEREYVKDLVPDILAEAARPMNTAQIFERLRQVRSVSPYSLSGIVRKIPEVRDFGFGLFGLHAWGDDARESIVANKALLERIIRRSEPPLSFHHLCEILKVPVEGTLAERLWHTAASLATVILHPAERGPGTLVLHRSCPLERALVATARAANRPLPHYEFQWELNSHFGPLFADRLLPQIKRCLEQSRLFLRDADEAFILDVNLDRLGLHEPAIRSACLEVLRQSGEIVGCDDLMERLEADGRVWEELSPDILGSLLREDRAFQEVGRNRFRAKPCKH